MALELRETSQDACNDFPFIITGILPISDVALE
jgi:hypothetical protein